MCSKNRLISLLYTRNLNNALTISICHSSPHARACFHLSRSLTYCPPDRLEGPRNLFHWPTCVHQWKERNAWSLYSYGVQVRAGQWRDSDGNTCGRTLCIGAWTVAESSLGTFSGKELLGSVSLSFQRACMVKYLCDLGTCPRYRRCIGPTPWGVQYTQGPASLLASWISRSLAIGIRTLWSFSCHPQFSRLE